MGGVNAGASSIQEVDESARTVIVDGLQKMVPSLESEEKVLRHFNSFGASWLLD